MARVGIHHRLLFRADEGQLDGIWFLDLPPAARSPRPSPGATTPSRVGHARDSAAPPDSPRLPRLSTSAQRADAMARDAADCGTRRRVGQGRAADWCPVLIAHPLDVHGGGCGPGSLRPRGSSPLPTPSNALGRSSSISTSSSRGPRGQRATRRVSPVPFDQDATLWRAAREPHHDNIRRRCSQRLILMSGCHRLQAGGGMKTSPPPSDPLAAAIHQVVKSANWKLTFACACAILSRLVWPLLPDDTVTHGLTGLFGLSLGVCLGKPLDGVGAKRVRKRYRQAVKRG